MSCLESLCRPCRIVPLEDVSFLQPRISTTMPLTSSTSSRNSTSMASKEAIASALELVGKLQSNITKCSCLCHRERHSSSSSTTSNIPTLHTRGGGHYPLHDCARNPSRLLAPKEGGHLQRWGHCAQSPVQVLSNQLALKHPWMWE